MADVSDPRIAEAVLDVRNDNTETNWATFEYKDKTVIVLGATGSGGHAELMQNLPADKVQFALLRLEDGDRESRRVKFIFLIFLGDKANPMSKARAGTHVGSIKPLMGLCHVDMQVDTHRECTEEIMRKKLKAAGGADYDTGSNATGYQSSGKIKDRALAAYKEKEKEGNVANVVYFKSALPSTTPVDLSNRPMVASATEARRNTVLDMKKPDQTKPKPVATNKPKMNTLTTSSSTDGGRRSTSPAAEESRSAPRSPAPPAETETAHSPAPREPTPPQAQQEEQQEKADEPAAFDQESKDEADAAKKEQLFTDYEAEGAKETTTESEEPAAAAAAEQEEEEAAPAKDTRTFSAPFADVKAFLVRHGALEADFDGSPEDLARRMAE